MIQDVLHYFQYRNVTFCIRFDWVGVGDGCELDCVVYSIYIVKGYNSNFMNRMREFYSNKIGL
jgi:hypothetical protein